jgi:DNA gyrase/topoisomerase IV subunit A
MDFELPHELRLLKEQLRHFVDTEIIPIEREAYSGPSLKPDVKKHLEKISKEMGLWLIDTPEEYGGLGLSLLARVVKNLVSLKDDEKVVTLMAMREFPEDHYLVFATSDGTVKKTALAAYANIRSNGLIALNIEEGNSLISVRVSHGDQQIFLISAQGKAIRFPEEDVRAMGRVATGVRGMRLGAGDHLVDMEVADPLPDLPEGVEADESTAEHGMLLTVTEKGYGKRTPLSAYRATHRGGQGIITATSRSRAAGSSGRWSPPTSSRSCSSPTPAP